MSESVEALRQLADVAIRDGESWNDRRLPEIGRALHDVLARLAETEEERVELWSAYTSALRDLDAAEVDRDRYRDALERIKAQQPETLEMIRRNGFVFDSIGHEPGNWQHLAFTIYNDLCSVDTIVRAALDPEQP
jgi:hypothetical protein